jgi:hypothetical protein
MKNQLFHNEGNGRFSETTSAGGPAFERAEISRGAAFGDIDNDGDIDVLVTNNGGPVRLLLNQSGRGNHWLQVTLEQSPGNRLAFGARIGLERTGSPTLWRRVRTDGSYLSASDLRVHFGLGPTTRVDGLVVQWPDGPRERWRGLGADRAVRLRRGTGQPVQLP